jgi:hypothetical protein
MDSHESILNDAHFHRGGCMHERAKWIAEELSSKIVEREPEADVPAVARV